MKPPPSGGTRLSDTGIVRRLLHPLPAKRIVITPLIRPDIQIGADTVDLRLGTEFIVTEQGQYTHADPASTQDYSGSILAKRFRHIKRSSIAHPFVLHPGRFTLASTLEFVALPADIAAHVEGRSSWARLGIQVHSTATNIHPWSASIITFELQNFGDVPVELYPGMRLGQLAFFELDHPASEPSPHHRKYYRDLQASASRFTEDYEIARIRIVKKEYRKRNFPTEEVKEQ